MRQTTILLLLSAAALSGLSSAEPRSDGRAGSSKVILISIDGLRPEFYLDPSYEAPFLQQLVRQGASAKGVMPIYPSVTYANHATLLTGVRSARHGILSNEIFSLDTGPTDQWYWESRHFKSLTLLQAARETHKTTAIMSWPGSVGAQVDWLVPEVFPPEWDKSATEWEVTRRNTRKELMGELTPGNVDPKDFTDAAIRDQWMVHSARFVLANYRPDLLLLHIMNVDRVQHAFGREAPESRLALKEADQLIARLFESVDRKSTTVVITGDHGFADFDKKININTLFAKKGWINHKNNKLSSWKVMAAISGGQATVYSKDRELESLIVPYLESQARGRFRIISRKELDEHEAFPDAVCAIEPAEGYSMGSLIDGPLVSKLPRVQGQHGFLPTRKGMPSGMIAVGPGISPHDLGNVRLLDIAPTLAQILGIALPSAEGKPINLK